MSSIEGEPAAEIPPLRAAAPKGPAGIGGWLLLVAFGQVLAAFGLPVALAYELFDPENRKLFDEFPLAMYGELALNTALILLVLITTLLLFLKSRYFPRVLIFECIAGPLVPLAGLAWSAFAFSHQLGRPIGDFLETDIPEMMRSGLSMISAAIWIAYALKSKRVRNTFILGLSARDVRGGEAERLETPLLLVIGGIVVMLGAGAILLSVGKMLDRGVLNWQFVGGAVQVALGLLLLRGSDVARILLALSFALAVALWVWIAFLPGQGVMGMIGLLTGALLCAVVFWFLAFSKRFRAELEINEAKYRKPDDEEREVG